MHKQVSVTTGFTRVSEKISKLHEVVGGVCQVKL